jgi:psp operon transcriptional activator
MSLEVGWASFPGFSKDAEIVLGTHTWPGNVRELKNTIDRAIYRWPDPTTPVDAITFDPFESPYRLTEKRSPQEPVAPEDDPPEADPPALDAPLPSDFKAAVAGFEKDLLSRAYEANRFNQRDTAAALSLTYDQLRHALKKHGLL